MPCVDEQKRIVEFLDEKCEKIERIIEEILSHKLQLKQNYIFNTVPKYVVLTKRLKKVVIRAVKGKRKILSAVYWECSEGIIERK